MQQRHAVRRLEDRADARQGGHDDRSIDPWVAADAVSCWPVWPNEARLITASVMTPAAPPIQAWTPAPGGTMPKALQALSRKPIGTKT